MYKSGLPMDYFLDIILPIIISIVVSCFVLPRTMLSRFHNQNRFGVVNRGGRMTARARYIGGASFVPCMMIIMGIFSMIALRTNNVDFNEPLSTQVGKIFQLMTGMAMLYIAGILDDIIGSTLKARVIAIFVACALLPFSGLWLNNLYGLFGVYEIPFYVGMPLTVLLAMYFTATIALTDGIEGMATGQCSISLATVLALSVYSQSRLSSFVCCAAIGFTTSFFVINTMRKKTRGTFLGLSGSLPLGYLICFVIMCVYKNKEWHGSGDGIVMAATCTMLIPAFDMLRVLRSRFVDRRDMTSPDRNLLFHKLMRLGMKKPVIQIVILLTNIAFISLSSYVMNKHYNITLVLIGDIVLFALLHIGINYLINEHEAKEHSRIWEKSYGKEQWADEKVDEEIDNMKLEEAARYILENNSRAQEKLHSSIAPKMDITSFIPDGMNAFERNTKRIIDCIVAFVLLIVFSPLFLFCYILIKKDDGGPAIFKQDRVGRFGRHFYIYKFRSMRLDAEKSGPQLSHASGDTDDRLTKAGRFLRAHHLDELPQLWNVFCGDMAFIGYRPERLFYIKQIVQHDPRYFLLYQIRPGVTSYATLYNGYTDTMEKMLTRLELDLYYLKHRSWWFDAKILFLTFWHIIGGKRF